MQREIVERIASNPRYQQLRSRRSRLGWTLTALMMLVYYGFILLVAFAGEFLAQPLGDGVTTIGIPIGLGVIVFTVVITAIYVHRANTEYDTLSDQIKAEAIR